MIGYYARRHDLLTKFRRLQNAEAHFVANESGFRISSAAGTVNLQWDRITEVWRFPDYWLVFLSKAEFFTLPLSDFSDKDTDYILEKIRVQKTRIS